MPCIETVEEWMKLDDVSRQNAHEKMNYEDKFRSQMKNMMDGLLEPYGPMLAKLGFFNTMSNIENMISNFRLLLEKIIPNKDIYFTGQNKEEDV